MIPNSISFVKEEKEFFSRGIKNTILFKKLRNSAQLSIKSVPRNILY